MKKIIAIAVIMIVGLFFIPSPSVQVVKLKVTGLNGGGWQGTGFFVDDDLIMTAGHMVRDANNIIVVQNGKEYPALSWYLEDANLVDAGLIKTRTRNKESKISFKESKIGDNITFIGNPFGLFPIHRWGKIGGVNLKIDFFGDLPLILVDAAGNPGNSGSPIVLKNGNITGMVIGGRHNSDGMTFCIPARILQLVLNKYLAVTALQEAGGFPDP